MLGILSKGTKNNRISYCNNVSPSEGQPTGVSLKECLLDYEN